jgi:hypothetical protein
MFTMPKEACEVPQRHRRQQGRKRPIWPGIVLELGDREICRVPGNRYHAPES